jgi:TonB family protein
MYFDFEDYRPDTPTVEPAISRREGILLSLVLHLVGLGVLIYGPNLPIVHEMLLRADRARQAAIQRQLELDRARSDARFVFVQPRLDTPAPVPPPRAELSDQDRMARTVERPPEASNEMPYMRGNSPERVEAQEERMRAAGRGPSAESSIAEAGGASSAPSSAQSNPSGLLYEGRRATQRPESGEGRTAAAGGSLGDALRNLQRYVQGQSFDNPQGGAGAFGPAIQFDTKGVEFGPWIRRFIAQIKRNWLIPYAAMSMRGHVVVTFNVHKDGRITDLTVVGPSDVEGFNNAAYNALVASNPTQALPPEYPADKAFFTVTFYYNEMPPAP